MKKAILYVHGKGGNAQEGESYRKNCPDFDIYGVDYREYLPWTAKEDIRANYEKLRQEYNTIYLVANSIGAYFSMLALQGCKLDKALLISPILNMERLITDMMGWANVTEEELQAKGEIETNFGEVLSWEYLQYVRRNPILWDVPTEILYAGQDNLTSRQAVEEFVSAHNTGLTVMEEGEHWFHTEEQLAFLNEWMQEVMIVNKYDAVNRFAQKWCAKFEDPTIHYLDLVDHYMADDCAALEFEMDCGSAFQEKYGHAVTDCRALAQMIDSVTDIPLLGSAIYSQWRYFNHWAYSGAEILEPDNRKWFILALTRLAELSSLS